MEELYDLRKDPQQLINVADKAEYSRTKATMQQALRKWMRETGDPRASGSADPWDRYPYYGPAGRDREPEEFRQPVGGQLQPIGITFEARRRRTELTAPKGTSAEAEQHAARSRQGSRRTQKRARPLKTAPWSPSA